MKKARFCVLFSSDRVHFLSGVETDVTDDLRMLQKHYSTLSSDGLYSRISPGWQFSASQIATSVEKRMALIFPVFILDKLTFATPTFSESSFKLILRSAITRSRRRMIFPIPAPQSVSSASCCKFSPYRKTRERKNRIPAITTKDRSKEKLYETS